MDGTDPAKESLRYEHPFVLNQKGIVKAIAYDATFDKYSPVSAQRFDISNLSYRVSDSKADVLFDGNGYTAYYLPKGQRKLTVRLKEPRTICGFHYLPDQNRYASGTISSYKFYVDGKLMSSGEFSNIKANPIMQTVRFAPVKGQTLELVSVRNVDDTERTGMAEFSVITE